MEENEVEKQEFDEEPQAEEERIETEHLEEDEDIFNEILTEEGESRKEQKEEKKPVQKIEKKVKGKEKNDSGYVKVKRKAKKINFANEEMPPRENIKKTLLEKAFKAGEGKLKEEKIEEPEIEEKGEKIERESELLELPKLDIQPGEQKITPLLKLLEETDSGNYFIGRKKNVYAKYGMQAALEVGKIDEPEFEDKRIFLDGLNPHVVFVCGSRGSGKCLSGDSLITLEDGSVVPIKELENNDKKILGLNHELKIVPLKKEGFYKRKVDKLLHLRLRSGREIKLTPEHPLLTINGWIQAQQLKRKDRIAVPRLLNAFGDNKMKECDVKLLAYFIAEGHLGNSFVLFSNQDNKILKDFTQSIQEFDENLIIKMHNKSGGYRVTQKKKKVDLTHIVRNKNGEFTNKGFIIAEKSSIAKWFESIDLYGKLAKEKFIPSEVLKLSKEQLALFLNRLFSCDGSIYRINKDKNNWSISYSSSSEKLIRQVQHLLLRFEIISRIREKTTIARGKKFNSFELVVSSESVIKFIKEIGFFGLKELKQETALKDMQNQSRNPNIDTIPKEIWNNFKPNWKKTADAMGYSPSTSNNTINFSPSREKLLKMSQINENKGIQMLAQSDIFWDEVAELKEIIGEEVFDISVPEYHNFVSNDIIVHNSYVLGVIAEELALKNKNVGLLVIDPIGVFWSMKFANKEEKELEKLKEWKLKPQGLKNVKVFVPEGKKNAVPKNTFDASFSIPPSMLTAEDWCLTFGMERFGPSGLLLDKLLHKLEHGYKTQNGDYIKAKQKQFALNDLIECLELDAELNSRDKGYKMDSIRALVSRFEAAKAWGIFGQKGTPLSELSREGQLTILDTSFLEDNVTSLVIGLLARRILAARKISTRKEAASKLKSFDVEELLELEIPPTWLFIDEAHTLIPSGNLVTPATNALVEYVKQGRQPGCSLVFATQQPSAISTKVLSQLDILISHKLVFDDDIKAVFRRTPAVIPHEYKRGGFIRSLNVGTALVADRAEETSRAFVMNIRPRMSQHEGREAETTDRAKELDDKQVEQLAVKLIMNKLDKDGIVEIPVIAQVVETLNLKHKSKIMLSTVLDALEQQGLVLDQKTVSVPGKLEELEQEKLQEKKMKKELKDKGMDFQEDVEEELQRREKKSKGITGEEILESEELDEAIEQRAFALRINENELKKIVDKVRKKKTLGLMGKEEKIIGIKSAYQMVYKINFHEFSNKNEFIPNVCFVDSMTGEFLHYHNNKLLESNGLSKIKDLSEEEGMILSYLNEKKKSIESIKAENNFSEEKMRKLMDSLAEKGYLKKQKTETKTSYFVNKNIDLPPNPNHALISSMNKVPITEQKISSIVRPAYSGEEIRKSIENLWKNVKVKKIAEIFMPIYEVTIKSDAERIVRVNALTGKLL